MTDKVLSELIDAIDRGEPVALVTVTDGTGPFAAQTGRHCLVRLEPEGKRTGDLGLGDLQSRVTEDARDAILSREHRTLEYAVNDGRVSIFVEVQAQPPHLIVVGAGHIAVPLASMASLCDFQVTVLDDRPLYANVERFPEADRVIAGPFRDELRAMRENGPGLNAHTYVVLVTRGHQHDVECLVEVLDDPLAYIGMIGSQRRIQAVFQLLESEQGIDPRRLDRIYAPVGLDIGARTPAEIAVCIMAEIINVLRGGPAESLSEQLRRERSARRERARASV